MKAIDLCCGVGGLTLGMRRAGWDVIAGIDANPAVGQTYVSNNPGSKFVAGDLRCLSNDTVRTLAKSAHGEELLLAGCAPCQSFSKQRRRNGLGKRMDATLLGEFARIVMVLKPKVVLMENVPGIFSVPGFSSFRRFLKVLRDSGYECDHRVVNAQDFGVPQYRRRYVLLAGRETPVALPVPTASPQQGPGLALPFSVI